MVFHVLNRGNDRRAIFDDQGDYEAFVRILHDAQERSPMRLLAYCLMPNHWHLLLWRERTARRLGLEFTLRPRGRPPKQKK